MVRECPQCGEEFKIGGHKKQKYCSHRCAVKYIRRTTPHPDFDPEFLCTPWVSHYKKLPRSLI